MLEEILQEIEAMEYPFSAVAEAHPAASTGFETAKNMIAGIIRRHMEDDGWIPCEEGLPEEDGTYLCTYDGEFYKEPFVSTDEYDTRRGWRYGVPVAWQPLPAGYHPKQKTVGGDYEQQIMDRFMKVE